MSVPTRARRTRKTPAPTASTRLAALRTVDALLEGALAAARSLRAKDKTLHTELMDCIQLAQLTVARLRFDEDRDVEL